VLEAGATRRRIRLPQGAWHDFWTGDSWQGPGEIDYPAPLDRLPLLARGGTILPMGPVLQHIPDDHRFDELQLHVWPPYPASGTLYEDDGSSLEYARGGWSRTLITAEAAGGEIIVRISAAQGGFVGQPVERLVELILHRSAAPAQVMVNGQPSPEWSFAGERGETSLRLTCSIFEETVIRITARS
jgi:alpha-glucosidase